MVFFLIWGSGTKVQHWDLNGGENDGKVLECVYKYGHFMFFIRWIKSKQWYIRSDNRSEDRGLHEYEVRELLDGGVPPINVYEGILRERY